MGDLFVDKETTAVDPAFDHILHFDAVRPDRDVMELDHVEVRDRLRAHVVPHPRVPRTNHLSTTGLTHRCAQSHYEMICEMLRCAEITRQICLTLTGGRL